MSSIEEDEETAAVFGFTLVMTGEEGLFECRYCSALCRRAGLSQHSVWHEHLAGVIYGDGS